MMMKIATLILFFMIGASANGNETKVSACKYFGFVNMSSDYYACHFLGKESDVGDPKTSFNDYSVLKRVACETDNKIVLSREPKLARKPLIEGLKTVADTFDQMSKSGECKLEPQECQIEFKMFDHYKEVKSPFPDKHFGSIHIGCSGEECSSDPFDQTNWASPNGAGYVSTGRWQGQTTASTFTSIKRRSTFWDTYSHYDSELNGSFPMYSEFIFPTERYKTTIETLKNGIRLLSVRGVCKPVSFPTDCKYDQTIYKDRSGEKNLSFTLKVSAAGLQGSWNFPWEKLGGLYGPSQHKGSTPEEIKSVLFEAGLCTSKN